MPVYEVSEGTSNLLQAYHEAKDKINQALDFLTIYRRTNIHSFGEEQDRLLADLEESGKEFCSLLQQVVLDNISIEMENTERYV